MGKRTAIWRSLWVTALLMQIVLDYLSYPRLIAIAARNAPWSPSYNLIGLDILGAASWVMLLYFAESQTILRDSKWMYRLGLFAFSLLSVCVVLTNLNAWK
jgi:hypothetical protein